MMSATPARAGMRLHQVCTASVAHARWTTSSSAPRSSAAVFDRRLDRRSAILPFKPTQGNRGAKQQQVATGKNGSFETAHFDERPLPHLRMRRARDRRAAGDAEVVPPWREGTIPPAAVHAQGDDEVSRAASLHLCVCDAAAG